MLEKKLLEKVVEELAFRELKSYYYRTTESLLESFEGYKEEELEVIFDIICNSKKLNYLVGKDGTGYHFIATNKGVKDFINDCPLADEDTAWNEYVRTETTSFPLKCFVEEK